MDDMKIKSDIYWCSDREYFLWHQWIKIEWWISPRNLNMRWQMKQQNKLCRTKILENIEEKQDMTTVLFCANKFTCCHHVISIFYSLTKHINLKIYYTREVFEDEVLMKHVKTENQIVDFFIEVFSWNKFVYFRELCGAWHIKILIKRDVKINFFF